MSNDKRISPRNRADSQQKETKTRSGSKKFIRQIIISAVCFALIKYIISFQTTHSIYIKNKILSLITYNTDLSTVTAFSENLKSLLSISLNNILGE